MFDSWITGIIGVVIGSILTGIVTILINNHEFKVRTDNSKIILISELNINVDSLKKFKDRYLKYGFREYLMCKSIQDVEDFYINLEKFPVLNYDNWKNLIIYVPYIFNESEIRQIIKFNKNLDLLYELSKILSKKQHEPNSEYDSLCLDELDEISQEELVEDHLMFENLLNSTIENGENILKFSNKKIMG